MDMRALHKKKRALYLDGHGRFKKRLEEKARDDREKTFGLMF